MVESSLSDVPSEPNSVDKILMVELDENATAEQKQEAINTRMDTLFNDMEKGLINQDSREETLGQLQEVCSGLDSFTFKDQNGNDVEASFQKQDYINMNKRVVGMASNVFKSDMERHKLKQKEQEQNQKAGPQQKQQGQKKASADDEANIYLALIEALMAIFKLLAKILGAADKLEESMNARFANIQPLSFKGNFLSLLKRSSPLSPEMLQEILNREDIDPSIAEAMKQEQDLSAMANDSAEPAMDKPEEPSEPLNTEPEQASILAEETPAPEEIAPVEPDVLAPEEEVASVVPEDVQPALEEPDIAPADALMVAAPEEQAPALPEEAPALEGAAPAEPAVMSVEQASPEGTGNEIAIEQEAAPAPAQADVQMEAPVAAPVAAAAIAFTAFQSNSEMTGKKKQTPKQINTAKIKKILSPKAQATTMAFIENHRERPLVEQVQTLKFA